MLANKKQYASQSTSHKRTKITMEIGTMARKKQLLILAKGIYTFRNTESQRMNRMAKLYTASLRQSILKTKANNHHPTNKIQSIFLKMN